MDKPPKNGSITSKVIVEPDVSDHLIEVYYEKSVALNYWFMYSLMGSKSKTVLKRVVSISSWRGS